MTDVASYLVVCREENKTDREAVLFPDHPFRHIVVILIREALAKDVETEHLIDWIEEMWNTVDILVHRFGEENAYKIIHARLGITSLKVEGSENITERYPLSSSHKKMTSSRFGDSGKNRAIFAVNAANPSITTLSSSS